MAKITNETFAEINDTQKFLDFLSINMYEDENSDILLNNCIDEYIKNILNIIDFETNYEMEGLYTTYDNYNSTNRNNIENIIKSFNETGNNNIAELMKKIIKIYKLNETKIINNYPHAVINFKEKYCFCRIGFPPNDKKSMWSKDGHNWNEEIFMKIKNM
jgi:hypothetical protein